MKMFQAKLGLIAVLALAMAGCHARSPDVTSDIRKSLDQAGLKDVSVSQDRDKGIITLDGNVKTDADKAQAGTIAQSFAAGQVVANQVAVLPPGSESEAKAINSDFDQAIKSRLDAALIQNKLHKHVKFDVKNGVVTLKGDVPSQGERSHAEQIATAIPNVTQVVNDLQTRNQKATSSN